MKKLYVCLHSVNCHVLWLVNLALLTIQYLAFDTQVDHGFYTPVTLTQPNLTLCFDLNSVLDGQETPVFSNNTPQYLGLTSQEIFDRVPAVKQILKRCAFRDPSSDQIVQVENSTECGRLFTIKRYRMHCFICYLFQFTRRYNFSFNALAFSPNEPKFLYNVAIQGPLTNGHSVAPLVHFDELADVDRIYMKELFPSRKNHELYHLEFDLYEIERLPHPYTTRCAADPALRCLYNCYNRGFAKISLILITSVVPDLSKTQEGSSFKVIKYNNTIQNKLRKEVTGGCAKLCKPDACSQKLVITHIFGPFSGKSYKLGFNVGSYRSPINLMKYSPKLSLTDYLTQSLSLSGIWVGFSIVALIYRRKKFDIVNAYSALSALTAKFKSRNFLLRTQIKKNSARKMSPEDKLKRRRSRKFCHSLSTTFKLTILLIFTSQAFKLCFKYFKFETMMVYRHIINQEYPFRLPSTVICLDFNDLFPVQKRSSVTEQNYEDIFEEKNPLKNLTLEEMFNKTIGEDILMQCRVKSYGRNDYLKGEFKLKSREECLREEFTFHKYYSRWQMCYLFKPVKLPENPTNFQQHHLAFGALNTAKLYSLILNPKIKNYGKIDLIVEFVKDKASFVSDQFRAISPSLSERRVVFLTFHTTVFEFLPFPYNTRCDPVFVESQCLNRCRASRLTRINRIPYTNLVEEKLNKKFLSFKDLKNSSVNDFYWQVESECEEKCQVPGCSGNYTLTYSRHAVDRSNFEIELVISPEANPRTHYWTVASFELHEFLYQMFCLLAFWLGFSFLGLNFIKKTSDARFNEAARFLYSQSIILLLNCLLITRIKVQLGKVNVLKRNLLIKRVACYSFCVLGMLLHLFLPISDYLDYPTKLLMTIKTEEPIPYKLSLCSEAQELYTRGILFGKNRKTSDNYIFDRNMDEIVDEAKKLDHSMSACGYWGLSRETDETNKMKKVTDRVFFESSNSSICEKSFCTKIFLRQGYICFEYKLRRKTTWNRSQMIAAINEAKTVLSVSFNSSILSDRFTVIAHSDGSGFPTHSSIWAPPVYFKKKYRFIVSYSSFLILRLPFPYSDKGFISSQLTHCLRQCINNRVGQFNFTRIGIGEQLSHNKLLSNSQRSNSLVNSFINEIDRQCDRRCLKNNLLGESTSSFYMVTTISEPLPQVGDQNSTRFDLRRTDDPVVEMKFFVAISIFDLIINIGSVISIWFGLSVINIPDLASEDDMEKMYIRTVDNLEKTDYILKRIATVRRTTRTNRIVRL